MFLARVTGTVVATVKDPALVAGKLLVVQALTPEGEAAGRPQVALDAVGAGVGEVVYCCRGKESTFAFLPRVVPGDLTIIGIVDPAANKIARKSGSGRKV